MALSIILLSYSCSTSDDELTVSRDIRIINDEKQLSSRMTYFSDTLEITNAFGRVERDFELVLEGELDAPQIDGRTLQAVSVSNAGERIFVSYNYAGESYLGGVDYITQDLVLKASIHYTDAEVNAVTIGGNHLYMAGATALDSPAYIESVRFSGNGFSLETNERASLGSYASTSVLYHKDELYVTTGNDETNGGGLYHLDAELNILGYTPLHDARWVMDYGDYVLVAQGTPGTISAFEGESVDPVGSFAFEGANSAEAKTTIDIADERILIAAGEDGVRIHDLADGKFLYSITFEEIHAVANAVTAHNGLIFISNGTNVYVASYDQGDKQQAPVVLGKIEFDDELSANHVLYRAGRMYVASGMGGVKMVKVIK